MNDEGMLVRRGWLEKADAHITKQDAAPAPEYAPASRFYDIRPARLQTAWTQNQAGLWTATARFIVNDVVDDSFTFPVCAPTATSSPGGTAGTSRFFVVWRGRWEMIAGISGSSARYTGGDHIQVSGVAGPNGYAIDNKGLCEAKLVTRGQADSYADTGTLYLGGAYFKWVSSTLDIVGKKELWLKTGRKRVVTDVTLTNGNLNVTTEEIVVLDDSGSSSSSAQSLGTASNPVVMYHDMSIGYYYYDENQTQIVVPTLGMGYFTDTGGKYFMDNGNKIYFVFAQ